MAIRRDRISTCRTSPDTVAPPRRVRSQTGITTWFETIVDSAIAATITIEVAAENPPRKDSIASPSRPWLSGTVST